LPAIFLSAPDCAKMTAARGKQIVEELHGKL
jgi:hypothetical protein